MEVAFLVSSQTLRFGSKKSIKSIVGGQERMDVLSRCFLNLHRWKDKINANLSLIIFLSHPDEQLAITIPHTLSQNIIENEADSTRFLLNILSEVQESAIKIEKISFEALLKSLTKSCKFYHLTLDGLNIDEIENEVNESGMCFILGSQYDLTQNQEKTLFDFDTIPVSLGKQNYLASHVITIVCYKLCSLNDSSKDNKIE